MHIMGTTVCFQQHTAIPPRYRAYHLVRCTNQGCRPWSMHPSDSTVDVDAGGPGSEAGGAWGGAGQGSRGAAEAPLRAEDPGCNSCGRWNRPTPLPEKNFKLGAT